MFKEKFYYNIFWQLIVFTFDILPKGEFVGGFGVGGFFGGFFFFFFFLFNIW